MDQLNELADLQEKDPTKEIMIEAFRKHGAIQTYRKNEFVFQENDQPSGAYYVDSGLIKISHPLKRGKG